MKSFTVLLLIPCLFTQVFAQQCTVAYYPFSGSANDVSGNNYHGTVVNATLADNRFGTPETAYDFNGTSSHIDLNEDFDLPVRSINLWFKADVIDAMERHIYISNHPALNAGFTQMKVVKEAGINHFRAGAGEIGSNGVSEVNEGEWYMATTVVNANSTSHYLNGNLLGIFPSGNTTSVAGHSTALIGTSRFFDRYFDGCIDDIKIFDCALTQTQIDSLYSSLCIIADYPFTGLANDITGNNYHGTPNNTTLVEDRYGAPASAYRFNGTSSHIELNEDFDLPTRTVNLWFNADVIDAVERHIYISDSPSHDNGFTQMKIAREGGINHYRAGAGYTSTNGIAVVNEGEWYMATTVVDTDSTSHYLNCELLGTFPSGNGISVNGHTTALLGTSRLFDRYFNGRIDDVKIFDCAITLKDVCNLYALTNSISEAGRPESNGLTVFPNPASSELYVSFAQTKRGRLDTVLYNAVGQAVRHQRTSDSNGLFKIDVSNLPTGFYSLVLSDADGQQFSSKVIIQ